MKAYRITIIICLIIALACGITYLTKRNNKLEHDERTNTECKTEQRIFDYNDVLSDDEESTLLQKIEEYEDAIGMDIVIVTFNNDTDFSYIDGMSDSTYYSISYFTELFTDYYRFGWEAWEETDGYGYDYEAGTSVVIAANWDTGDAWMCTSGRALSNISDSKASEIVEDGCEYLRSDPERGFEIILDETYDAMLGTSHELFSDLSDLLMGIGGIILTIIAAVVFFIVNFAGKVGKKTTNASTYVHGGAAKTLDKRDIFMHKNVTSIRISTDSGGGGGGGGGHSGGGHHGGGGGHF